MQIECGKKTKLNYTLYTVHCTVPLTRFGYRFRHVHGTLNTVHYTLYTIHCTVPLTRFVFPGLDAYTSLNEFKVGKVSKLNCELNPKTRFRLI